MKKFIPLVVVAMHFALAASFAQTKVDTSAYRSRKLKVDEVNLVSGYYQQDGNNSAVTGGIGTEHLTDLANTINIKLSRYSRNPNIEHHFGFELGVDTYTSASSDKIDPTTISSASSSDVRIYPSLSWGIENEAKRTRFDITASASTEYDYQSFGGAIGFTKSSADKNLEFNVKAQAFLDTWKVILPIELRNSSQDNHQSSPRNSFSIFLSLSKIINKNFQMVFATEPGYQDGLLATKYQRVYFTDNTLKSENLPGSRYKLPVSIRANYFLGDQLIIRSFYRFYTDNWGIQGHSAELELPVKITPFFSLSPFYRFYTQNQSQYFAPYRQHTLAQTYFTSDYDLSKFDSNFFGAGLRFAPPKGVFNLSRIKTAEIRYGYYKRSNGLNANILSLAVGFK
jgi:hypothetical protein